MSEKDKSYVLWLLGRQSYSRAQLEKKLVKRNLAPQEIKNLLDELIEKGFFDENEYKRLRTRQLIRKGYGTRAIRSKLQLERCNSSSEEIEEAFEDLSLTTQSQLEKLLDQQLRRLRNVSDPKKLKERLYRSLLSKGHSLSAIQSLFKERKLKI